jgi:hypothetical protein
LVRLAIKPDVLGKRIKLIRTDDPYLKPGDRGTIVDVYELPYEDTPFKVWVQWQSGSRLAILEGLTADNFLFIEQNDKVTVHDNEDFTLVTDSNDKEKRITISESDLLDSGGIFGD